MYTITTKIGKAVHTSYICGGDRVKALYIGVALAEEIGNGKKSYLKEHGCSIEVKKG